MPGNATKHVVKLAKSAIHNALKSTGGSITKGQALRIVGFDNSNDAYLVELAKADSISTMPSVGLAGDSFDNQNPGHVIIDEVLTGVNTSSFSVGDDLYVSADTAGALTNTKPSGDNVVEKIGIVIKQDATDGIIQVYNVGFVVHAEEAGGSLHDLATTSVAGFMSSADKTKLDGVETEADVTDATNVNSAGAVMHSDVSEAEGFLRKTGSETYEAIKTNMGAAVAPGVNDDSASGYSIGSRWLDTTADREYVCLDATVSSAVWVETTAGAAGGEANTSSNAGTGEGTLAKAKNGVDLPFKSLKQGSNITITNNENDVTIASSGGGGDVTAAAVMADNAVVRGDGGAKGVQDSLVTIDDNGKITGKLVLIEPVSPGTSNHIQLEVTQDSTDPYNLALDADPGRVYCTAQDATYRQAFCFAADGGGTSVIMGVAGSADSGSSWQPKFVVKHDAKVGIGKNNPGEALDVVGNIAVSGTVDGRDVATDGTKLDGIESSADVTDATNVAAAGAVMDSDISESEGFMRKTGAGAYEAIKTNLNASVAPTATDDSSSGYAVGSRWIDTTADKEYVCLDATASSAVWTETTQSGGGGVFGTEYGISEDDTLSETTGTVYIQKIKHTTGVIPAGDYKISFSFYFKTSSAAKTTGARVQLDDTTDLFVVDDCESEAFITFSSFTKRSLTNASHDIDIDFKVIDVGSTASIKYVKIEIFRLS